MPEKYRWLLPVGLFATAIAIMVAIKILFF